MPVRPPTVPQNSSRLRISLTSLVQKNDLATIGGVFVSINKALVAQRFAKAGQSYVEHAVVQNRFVKQLFEYAFKILSRTFASVLEIGWVRVI